MLLHVTLQAIGPNECLIAQRAIRWVSRLMRSHVKLDRLLRREGIVADFTQEWGWNGKSMSVGKRSTAISSRPKVAAYPSCWLAWNHALSDAFSSFAQWGIALSKSCSYDYRRDAPISCERPGGFCD